MGQGQNRARQSGICVVGHWSGDGITKVAVFRASCYWVLDAIESHIDELARAPYGRR